MNDLKKISNDLSFVVSPKFNNNIFNVLQKYPNGVSDKRAAKMLMLSESSLREIQHQAIIKLKNALKKYYETIYQSTRS